MFQKMSPFCKLIKCDLNQIRIWDSKQQKRMDLMTLNLFIFSYYKQKHTDNINNKLMFKYLLITLLLATSFASHDSDGYFLSPPLPPTAYKGEYYTVQFRVIGLDNPLFSFDNLPACLKSYDDGTIEGTPDRIGSFAVKVHFRSKGQSCSRDIVIRVAPSVSSTFEINTEAGLTSVNQFIVVKSNSSLTYLVGDKVGVSLAAQHGKAPYTWNYLNLPQNLVGNKDGSISGIFDKEGYYSFSASANDCQGSIAESYFTFNVQPTTVKTTSVLLEVPNRNVPVRYDLEQVRAQQLAAENAVFSAIRIVNDKQREAAEARTSLAKTTQALQFATAQENAANDNAGKALNKKKLAAATESKAHDILEAANNVVKLTKTNFKNAQDVTASAGRNLDDAQKVAQQASNELKEANNKFINAQTEASQAVQNTKAALTVNLNARNVYNLAFNTFSDAKKQLQNTQNQKQKADTVVASAQNAVNIVNQLNDNAQSALTAAQNIYKKSYSALNNANTLVSQIQQQLGDASDKLGVAKFNLQQAQNNLFVAQASKAQADKATEIVRAQSSILPADDSTSTYIFAGCSQQAYPTISGSAIVNDRSKYGYQLSTGNVLVFGSCTQKVEDCNTGDVITYKGYIKDGYVHCTSYRREK